MLLSKVGYHRYHFY